MGKRYYNKKIETMSREDFLALQWHELKKQVEYTYAKSGLCRRKFKEARITPDDIKNLDDFINKVPFTDKKEMVEDQKENTPYGTRLAIREDEIALTYVTSGTSGRGQETHTMSKADLDFYSEALGMLYTWGGWKAGDKVMNPLPMATTIAAPTRFLGLQGLGCDVFSLGQYDTKTKLDYMRRFKISGINASAAYLTALTSEIEEMGLDPARDFAVRKVMMAGQAYPISFVQRMEAKWNAKIYDYYGATQLATGCTCEKGAVTGGKRGAYHLFGFLTFHEIINPETGQHVKPGEAGEVVVTPLNKQSSVFLRFRMRDRATLLPRDYCDCGRPFDLIEAGTIARYDDMMKIKGMNIWPETLDEIIFSKTETAEYKGRVFITSEGKEKAEIYIEFRSNAAKETKEKVMSQIEFEIRDRTGIGFAIKETTEVLPRYVTKANSLRWSDERVKGLAQKKRMDKA